LKKHSTACLVCANKKSRFYESYCQHITSFLDKKSVGEEKSGKGEERRNLKRKKREREKRVESNLHCNRKLQT
jgi:hypothetical protein